MSLFEVECTRVRVSVEPRPGQTYAIHSEVFLDDLEQAFVIVKCHFHSKQPVANDWKVELRNEPGDEDEAWYTQFLEGGEMQKHSLIGIGDVFAQPTIEHMDKDEAVQEPLVLLNAYALGPTWTDFYRGSRKVARVYTLYYRAGKDLRGNELPELLWLHAKEDDVDENILQEVHVDEVANIE